MIGYRVAQPIPGHTLFTYAFSDNDRELTIVPQFDGQHAIGVLRPAVEQFLERYVSRLHRGNSYFPK